MTGKFYQAFAIILFALCAHSVFTQNLVDIETPIEVCLNEFLVLQNRSDPGQSYAWDFCSNELDGAYSSSSIGVITTFITDLAMVNDAGRWVAFATSRNGSLIRADFGNSPYNSPSSIVSLGNLNGLLNQPESISIIRSASDWIGFVATQNEIVRIEWGSSLLANPIGVSLQVASLNKLSTPQEIEVVKEGENYIAVVANSGNSTITLLNLGSQGRKLPIQTDIMVSDFIPGAADLSGVSVSKVCNEWILYAIASNKIYRIEAGQDLFGSLSTSAMLDFSNTIPVSIGQFNRIKAIVYGTSTFVYFTSFTGGYLYAAVWNEDQGQPEFRDLGNISTPPNPYVLESFRFQGEYGFFLSGFNNGLTHRVHVSSTCAANVPYSLEENPANIFYTIPGSYEITLTVDFGNGIVCSKTKPIVVKPFDAPLFSIVTKNNCVSSPVFFSASSSGGMGLISWNWSFGDSVLSTLENPVHQYGGVGEYQIRLQATATNGCKNTSSRNFTVWPPPNAGFVVPSDFICTNNAFTYTNTTIDDFDGYLTYEWFVNQIPISTERDLIYAFTSAGEKEVKLVASIPGCSSQAIQTIPDVGEGPLVDFNFSGKCAGDPIVFTNQTLGSIAGYDWDLGGKVSTQTNPTVSFNDPGNYTAKLKATGTNGCVSETSKPLKIYSKPVASFSLALPPFSCSGSPAQFTDTTPALTDSNLTGWAWSFGMGLGTSTQRNPSFTFAQAGNFPVELTVTSDQGCFAILTKSITIQQTPTVDFTNGPSCRNQRTQFTSITSAPIKSFQWNIGVNTYTTANPSHVFVTAGNSAVQVRIVAQNDCIASISKSITIPVELLPEFTVGNACAGKQVVFSNSTVAPNDPVRNVQWIINNQSLQGNTVNLVLANPGNYPVRMVVTGQSGCTYGIDQNVVINPTPSAGFAVSDEVGPPPLRILFTNTSQGANSFLWRFNDNLGTTSSNANPEFTFTALGDYGVDLIASNSFNCSDQITRLVRIITPVRDLEMIDYRVLQDPVSKLFVSQVEIKNNSNYIVREAPVLLNLGLGITFREVVRDQWLPGTTKTITLQNQLQTSRPLTFACAELAFPDDQVASNNKICISLNESSNWLPAYPNPADGFLIVPLIAASKEPVTIRLITGTGALAYEKIIDNPDLGLREWTIAINQLVPGLYTLVVQTGGSENRSRVLIKR